MPYLMVVGLVALAGCGSTTSGSDSSTAAEGAGGAASSSSDQSASGESSTDASASGGAGTTDATSTSVSTTDASNSAAASTTDATSGATGGTGGETGVASECVELASNGDKNCSDICSENGRSCVVGCFPQGVLKHGAAFYESLADCEDDKPLIFEVTACSADSVLRTSDLFNATYARCCCDGPAVSMSNTGSGGSSGGSSSQGDACDVIEGMTYRSLDELECGLGPNGVVLCNWSIEFSAGVFLWSYSDVGETGSYTCDGDLVLGMAGREIEGSLDPTTGELTWDGVVYTP